MLVGPSGCGKSTALRMLAGLEEITKGRILIGDRVVNNVAPASRDIAMVFQSYALYPHMTVYDNLAFGLRNTGVPKREIDDRVRRATEILQMNELVKRKPKQLSGGQRQRVALGRAIVREPKAFLMDEPLSNLDAKLRVETRARDPEASGPPRHDDDLRHARPGRGDDDGRPDRGHERRRPPAGRDARGGVHESAERLRGRVHRLAGDEPRAGASRRRRRARPHRGLPAGALAARAGRRERATASTRASRSSSTSATSSSSTSSGRTRRCSRSCRSSSRSRRDATSSSRSRATRSCSSTRRRKSASGRLRA